MEKEIINRYIELGKEVDEIFLNQQLDWMSQKLLKNIDRFQDRFPSACTTNQVYRIKGNDDWTNGFWTGMLWIAYLHTQDQRFLDIVNLNIESFKQRLHDHFVLDHHDIGFLYSPSIVAIYRDSQREDLKEVIIEAAERLVRRFQEVGGFIQAWGQLGDEKEYRLIIDSLLNLPLLYEASTISGNQKYSEVADKHYQQVINNIIRDDFSTYHTFYFNKEDGSPKGGATHQGYSDSSCWARGQAWAIMGIPLHDRIKGIKDGQELFASVLTYFINKLPQDLVPYWDLYFDDTSNEPKDSSALAIAACGMIEAQNAGYIDDGKDIARGMIYQLASDYTSINDSDKEGLLLHGVYAYSENKGVDEANLWGDYFYMEAIYRLVNQNWKTCW